MKIRIEGSGAQIVRLDFGMLREGLRLAQKTTPTALANLKARTPREHKEALIRLFAGASAIERQGAQGSFHPGLLSTEPRNGQR